VLVHVREDGSVKAANGRAMQVIDLNTVPTLSREQAIEHATTEWLTQSKPVTPSLFAVDAKLFIFDRAFLDQQSHAERNLVWEVKLHEEYPPLSEYYYIDSHDGSFLGSLPASVSDIHRDIYDCSYGDGACYIDKVIYGYRYGRQKESRHPGRVRLMAEMIPTISMMHLAM